MVARTILGSSGCAYGVVVAGVGGGAYGDCDSDGVVVLSLPLTAVKS